MTGRCLEACQVDVVAPSQEAESRADGLDPLRRPADGTLASPLSHYLVLRWHSRRGRLVLRLIGPMPNRTVAEFLRASATALGANAAAVAGGSVEAQAAPPPCSGRARRGSSQSPRGPATHAECGAMAVSP